MLDLILKLNSDSFTVYACKGIYSKKINAVIVSLDADNLQVRNTVSAP